MRLIHANIAEVKMSGDVAPRRHVPLWRDAEKAQCRLHVMYLTNALYRFEYLLVSNLRSFRCKLREFLFIY